MDDTNGNKRFKTLRILKQSIRFRCHRELPSDYKLSNITISRDSIGYYVSFGIEFKKQIDFLTSLLSECNKQSIACKKACSLCVRVSSDNLDISKSIGIDLNAYNFAVSTDVNFIQEANISAVTMNHLIDNGATNRKGLRYAKYIKLLERKQSRRLLVELKNSKSKKEKLKLGENYRKTQKKLNKLSKKISNQKIDLYHKITTQLTNKFDLIVVEDFFYQNATSKACKKS